MKSIGDLGESESPLEGIVLMDLLIGSTNLSKVEKLVDICSGLGIEIHSAGAGCEVRETASTHLGNAILKSVYWSGLSNDLAISSDGGIVIPALGGRWNSVTTARAHADSLTTHSPAEHLLRLMAELRGSQRRAWFIESIAISRGGTLLHAWESEGLYGLISESYVPESTVEDEFWLTGLWETAPGGKRLWQLSAAEMLELGDPWKILREPIQSYLSQLLSS